MKKLTNYEKDLRKRLKDPEFFAGFQEELAKLKLAYAMLELRKKHKLSQQEVAKRLGTTQSVVARMEAGEQNFTVSTLQKIADVFRKKLKIELV